MFSYSGRLANAVGEATRGPIDLELKFFREASGGTPLPVSPTVKRGVVLIDGVFQVDLSELTAAESHLVFAPNVATWVEVTDLSNRTTYPRQRLTAVPYAFKVPVDQSAITFDPDGRLTVASIPMSKVAGLEAAIAQKTDSSKPVYASGIQGKDVTATAPAAGQALIFNGSTWAPQTISVGSSGTVTNISATPPLVVTNGSTTPALSMAQATSVSSGYLTNTDYIDFTGKASQSALDTLSSQVFKKDGSVPLTGDLAIPSQKSLQMGSFTNSQESAFVSGLTAGGTANKGKTWYNSDTNQMKFYDGANAQTLGVAGAGITSLNGQTAGSQTFAIGTTGTSPGFSSTSGTHTLNIPLAAAAGVTGGLLSKTDYDSFTGKVTTIAAGSGVSATRSGNDVTVGLASTGVTAGFYSKADITVDAQGRITAASAGSPVNLATEVSGILSVGRGGTGMSSGTANGIPYFSSGSTMATTAGGTMGQVLLAGGGGTPTFGAVDLTSGSSVSGVLPLTMGGTGSTTASGARTNLSAAASGNNVDISALNFGNIGVGTTSPIGKLHVYGSAAPTMYVQAGGGNSEIKLGANGYYGAMALEPSAGHLTVKSYSGQVAINTGGFDALVVKPSGSVGIGTMAPTGSLSFGGTSPRLFNVERNPSPTAGNSLMIESGGAGFGASNLNGGDLVLSSGLATGTGSSKIDFRAVQPGSSGTADQTAVSRMTVHGTGVEMKGALSVKTVVIASGSAYTVAADDSIVIITSSSSFTVTLTTCNSFLIGRLLTIANRISANVSFSGTVSGSPSLTTANSSIRLVCDGAGTWQPI